MELQTFGINLKELRHKLNLTQREFTKDLSITPATLSAYEKGTANPSLSAITEIAQKYNISVDWLLGLSDKPTNNNSIETYADLIKFLVDISKTDLDINIISDYPVQGYRCGILINSYCSDFEKFFEDYDKMNALYKNGSIDEEVYNLWLEKTINKFKDTNITEFEDNARKERAEAEANADLPF